MTAKQIKLFLYQSEFATGIPVRDSATHTVSTYVGCYAIILFRQGGPMTAGLNTEGSATPPSELSATSCLW